MVLVVVVNGAVVCLSSWSRIISMMSIAVYFDLPTIIETRVFTTSYHIQYIDAEQV